MINYGSLRKLFPFSNFQPFEINYEGIVYPTVEHFYQAMKFDDHVSRRLIANRPTPGEAKTTAHQISGKRHDWDAVKVEIMRTALEWKFAEGTVYYEQLLTFTQPIIEFNLWHDLFWGICICEKCKGKGLNVLGKLLKEIRKKALKSYYY